MQLKMKDALDEKYETEIVALKHTRYIMRFYMPSMIDKEEKKYYDRTLKDISWK